ncbi:cytosolic Fe-S cluster assembly factor cfd1 [Varicellaria rhodocarpa]|nr:cytosolic Fe-S cluster assembly factor cfd1 [Varicellaria rhodocarpa]
MSLDKVKNIVLVLSGKGGVGKSSITTQLALSLSLAGCSVGILDIDLTGPSIPRLLGIESAKVKQAPGGWLPVEVHQSQVLQPVPVPTPTSKSTEATSTDGVSNGVPPSSINGNATSPSRPTNGTSDPQSTPIGSLHAMSLAFLLTTRSSAIVWRGPKKTAMVRQFLDSVLWPPLDYLLIDTPPGTSDEHISLVETLLKTVSPDNAPSATRSGPHLAGAVIVTTPQAVAISDVRKEINFCGKVGVKVIGVVENMSGYVCECCGVGTNLFSKGGGEIMSREFGVKFLGSVPLDGQWGVLIEEGRRPRYGITSVPTEARGNEEDHRDEEETEKGENDKENREEGLLIDRYRSCSLCLVFEGIAKQVIDTVTNGTSVSVKALNA